MDDKLAAKTSGSCVGVWRAQPLSILEGISTWRAVQRAVAQLCFKDPWYSFASFTVPYLQCSFLLCFCPTSEHLRALLACPGAGTGCFTGHSAVSMPSPVCTDRASVMRAERWGRGGHRLYLCRGRVSLLPLPLYLWYLWMSISFWEAASVSHSEPT